MTHNSLLLIFLGNFTSEFNLQKTAAERPCAEDSSAYKSLTTTYFFNADLAQGLFFNQVITEYRWIISWTLHKENMIFTLDGAQYRSQYIASSI